MTTFTIIISYSWYDMDNFDDGNKLTIKISVPVDGKLTHKDGKLYKEDIDFGDMVDAYLKQIGVNYRRCMWKIEEVVVSKNI